MNKFNFIQQNCENLPKVLTFEKIKTIMNYHLNLKGSFSQ